jgi:hypothetical protein
MDDTANTFDIWIDEVLEGSDLSYRSGSTAGVDTFRIYTVASDNGYSISLDSLSYSSDYPVGTNQKTNTYAHLNLTVDIDVSESIRDLTILEFELFSFYKTSEITNISYYIYNFSNSQWILINNSIKMDYSFSSNYSLQTPNITDFINSSGTMKIMFEALNYTVDDFEFSMDQIEIQIWTKLHLSYTRSFSLLGTWKYRWRIIGSNYLSNWTYFNVINQESNLEIISESKYYTQWDFSEQGISPTTIYSKNFSEGVNDWNLFGVSQTEFIKRISVGDDAYVYSKKGNTNYGSEGSLELENILLGAIPIPYSKYYFIKPESLPSYLTSNLTDVIRFFSYIYNLNYTNDPSPDEIRMYSTGDFDENTITYNNQPSTIALLSTYNILNNYVAGWHNYSLGTQINSAYGIVGFETLEFSNEFLIETYSKENLLGDNYDPYFIYNISKFFQGSGILYCQTNITETLTLRSSDTLNLNLQEGDRIEVIFNTTSNNKIDLNLKNNGVQQKSYILSSQGNADYSTRTKTFIISQNFTMDQLEFTGIFDNTKNLIIDKILIYRPSENQFTYYLDPFGRKELVLQFPKNYSIEIYEEESLEEIVNITTSETLQTIIFESIVLETCYITFYDSNNEYLEFSRFITYVNYTYDENTVENERLSDNILSVDDDTSISFNIYDSFNVLVKNYQTYEETFIDITLNVYSLKIKNEAKEYVNYTLKNNASSIIKTGNIFPEEIIKFHISSGIYLFNYTNNENDLEYDVIISLTDHEILVLNSTYFDVYFSLFTYDGLGINHDLVRFYINGYRKDFGFNTLKQDTNTLMVLDYFNQTLFNKQIDLSRNTEYNIFIEVYSMILFNNYSHAVKIQIERNDIEFEQIIESNFGFSYRMLPKVEYQLSVFYLNGTLIEEKEIELDVNNKIVSFGFYEVEVSDDFSRIAKSYENIIVLILFGVGVFLIVVGIALYLQKKNQGLKEKRRNSSLEHKLKSTSYSRNLAGRG